MASRDDFDAKTDSRGITQYMYKRKVGGHTPVVLEYPPDSPYATKARYFAIGSQGKAGMFKTLEDAMDYAVI